MNETLDLLQAAGIDTDTARGDSRSLVFDGGEVILVNHFSQTEGVRGWVERRMAPFAEIIGWRPVFDQSRVMGCEDLTVMERKALRPWGIFTMMRFRKTAGEDERPIAAE